jgi:hypothetical protein
VLHCMLLLQLSAANVKKLFCDSSVRVLCLVSWWLAGMLVHHVTSSFVENTSLFVVVSLKFRYIVCVCNLERSRILLLQV